MATYESKQDKETSDSGKPSTELALQSFTPPRTPTATTSAAQKLYSQIQHIHTSLATLPSLVPGEQINELLTRLVNLCILPYSADFTASFFAIRGVNNLCSTLRTLCSSAEGELESFWAVHILRGARAKSSYSPPNAGPYSTDTSPKQPRLPSSVHFRTTKIT
jgi:hypothetical protein